MAKKYLQLRNTLKKLLLERDMKPVELSREVNLPPTTIHRLLTGKSTRPYQSSLEPIADFFDVTIDQLLGESPLEKQTVRLLPFISWEKLTVSLTAKTSCEIPFAGKIGVGAFATKLLDSSMSPQFSKNSLLIFDPEKNPVDRSYVLAALEEKNFIFRQLLIDVEHRFLKPLNPDLMNFKMKMLHKKDCIIATLVEARHAYHDE